MQRFMAVPRALMLLAAIAASATTLHAQSVTVLGSANPNLAGRANGYACCSGDVVPNQAAPFISVTSGGFLTFAVRGFSDYTGSQQSGNNPDGNSGSISLANYGDGISAPLSVRYNALFGVFLGSGSPTGTQTPAQLDFSSGLNFASLAPGIGQIFFIGDGRTTDTNQNQFNGALQMFTVPTNATRLFFGSGDGFGWYNNSGSFDVTATSSTIPEPATLVLLAFGLAGFGVVARRRKVV